MCFLSPSSRISIKTNSGLTPPTFFLESGHFKMGQMIYSTSMEAFLRDLLRCLALGDGENSHGTTGSSISPSRILTTSPLSGLSSGILCKHNRAKLMHRPACSLLYELFNLSSTSSRRFPI
ncbi:hypothetical protein MUK42_32563 [Musa troglodytarum]|uniref:Uncharacterized protein n=1 Tax=Musa troglodytarum TaxID=320322 RepID=A0A9E7I0P9_9LILI|nr:hypothetical protein MUK42_32563 [Musa troglodytarum]